MMSGLSDDDNVYFFKFIKIRQYSNFVGYLF